MNDGPTIDWADRSSSTTTPLLPRSPLAAMEGARDDAGDGFEAPLSPPDDRLAPTVTCDASAADDDGDVPSSNLFRRLRPRRLLASFFRRTAEHRRNLTLAELSGSLGDLGTFIPLTVALARERRIALAPALFWAGVSNIVTGYAWDVPMCVQPMKSIAAVALTDVAAGGASGSTGSSDGSTSTGLDALSVTTAGILTGGCVLILGVTNLMEVVNWIVPLTVVCGLQVGVGLRLASKGIQDVQKLTWGGGYDCIGLAVACALLSMFWLRDNGRGTAQKNGTKEGGQESASIENSQANAIDTGVVPGTVANSMTASSEEDGREAEDNMELGQMDNVHSLDTGKELHHRAAVSATARTAGCTSFSTLSAPSPSSHHHTSCSTASPSCSKLFKRVCCCLDPFPNTPHPVGIYLFLIGCLFAAITLATAGSDSGYDLPLKFFGAPMVINALEGVKPINWRQGFFQGALPQLPLTTLNSVISVCCLAHNLYPDKRDPALAAKGRTDSVVTRREVSVSVGLMNLVLCPLGSMPNCHGAGGLAGQHRFGARHGTSVVVLGLLKVLLAVFLGGSALTLLDALPAAVLGVMLAIAGLELVGTGVGMLFDRVGKEREEVRARAVAASSDGADREVDTKSILRKNALIAMVTAAVIVALKKTHYGAISGWVVHMVYGDGCGQFLDWIKMRRQKRRGDG
ncbi:hypothetical protein ACHAWF_018512 [Thalassiosira exigua]